jgi:hypothetical protein
MTVKSNRAIEESPSPAVWAPEFPTVEYLFNLIEGQAFVPDGTFHVGIPVEFVASAVVIESEEKL